MTRSQAGAVARDAGADPRELGHIAGCAPHVPALARVRGEVEGA